jgi:nucleotide-binding universal stress UspA family protein
MKTIVVPFDFSPISLNAVNYAADMACAIDAGLSILHIYQVPMAFSEVPIPAEVITDSIKEAEEKLSKLKEDILLRTGGRLLISTAIKTGGVISELSDYCDTLHPYAVVMGMQGSGALERFIFGSNTLSAMKNLSWPLIIIPQDAKFSEIRKIGLACDLKKVSETSPVSEIKKLVKDFQAQLHVLHINMEKSAGYGQGIIKQSEILTKMLGDLHPVYHFLHDTGIEEGLTRFAEKNKLDMLIIVPKKHSFFETIFHKSHSKEIALHTHVPVISVTNNFAELL